MTWSGQSETLTAEDVRSVLGKYWDPNELVNGRAPKNLWKKPSSGLYMIAHALKNQGDKCVHILGFNFGFRADMGYKTEHPFQDERRLVQRLLREEDRVFFHPMLDIERSGAEEGFLYGV
eukprot:CAMPEP_0177611396 /NCGR_PEP_ID=MMETSP0419_2-20121207/20464_1 /TAXON_ID=582737 /ORGANISM="Tetraselmis sp., Strain GSL018" /LENGTH=119 /DNA_ID=CAMNT_0019107113 /DNA_START=450 /DNA_END=809 /DNA_ORIENTATION=+